MMAATTGAEVYQRGARAGARPDPELKVSEWADQFRSLTVRSSPEPGPWRTARVPYLRDIMDDLSPSARVEIVVFQAGAQRPHHRAISARWPPPRRHTGLGRSPHRVRSPLGQRPTLARIGVHRPSGGGVHPLLDQKP
jgi:hypothetical protein